jgi:DNA replication protein DnaC
MLTSNKTYGEWGDIFSDQVLAAAILDRLLHHSVTISIRARPTASRTNERAESSKRRR